MPTRIAAGYVDHPIGHIPAPRDSPYYNYSAQDKHAFFPFEPPIASESAATHIGDETVAQKVGCSVDSINAEYSKRLRSLLSVDDIVVALEATLKAAGEWDNTFIICALAMAWLLSAIHCVLRRFHCVAAAAAQT